MDLQQYHQRLLLYGFHFPLQNFVTLHFHLHKTTSGTFNSQVTGAILHTSTNNSTLILNMSIKKMVFLLYWVIMATLAKKDRPYPTWLQKNARFYPWAKRNRSHIQFQWHADGIVWSLTLKMPPYPWATAVSNDWHFMATLVRPLK